MPDLFIPQDANNIDKAQGNDATAPASSTKTVEKKTVQPSNENHLHGFADFCENPVGTSFRSQSPGEKILLFTRRAFITNIPWILVSIILAILPFFFFTFLSSISISVTLPQQFILVFSLSYYLLIATYAFVNFIDWFYNIFIVTQREVVDVDYSDIVYHDVASTNLNLVEDVNYIQSGFIPSLFNFGDVFVQTAGKRENIEALAIPRPARAAQIVLNLIGRGEGEGG